MVLRTAIALLGVLISWVGAMAYWRWEPVRDLQLVWMFPLFVGLGVSATALLVGRKNALLYLPSVLGGLIALQGLVTGIGGAVLLNTYGEPMARVVVFIVSVVVGGLVGVALGAIGGAMLAFRRKD